MARLTPAAGAGFWHG